MTVSLMRGAIHARRIFKNALGIDGSVGTLLMDCTIDEVDEVLTRDRTAARSPRAPADNARVDVIVKAGPLRIGLKNERCGVVRVRVALETIMEHWHL